MSDIEQKAIKVLDKLNQEGIEYRIESDGSFTFNNEADKVKGEKIINEIMGCEKQMEILAGHMDDYFIRTGIKAEKKWEGKVHNDLVYQVWKIAEEEFKKLNDTTDESYRDYEWWRYSEGSNLGDVSKRFNINGHYIIAWDGEQRKDTPKEEQWMFTRKYPRLTTYFSDELSISQPRNVCALAADLAKQNNMTMAELFSKYESELNQNDRDNNSFYVRR